MLATIKIFAEIIVRKPLCCGLGIVYCLLNLFTLFGNGTATPRGSKEIPK